MAEKEAVLKVKATELTYTPDGRQYLPGDEITFTGALAEIAAAHYKKPLKTVDADPALQKAKQTIANSNTGS